MLHSQSSRVGSILLLLTAIIAFAVALYAWWTLPMAVTGTIGALGVVIASVVLAILTFMLRAASRRGARVFLIIVTLVVLAGIAFAAALLHQYIITAAMVVGLIGLIMLSSHSARYNHPVRS